MDLTTQALDLFFDNEAIQARIIKPIKKRAVPLVVGTVIFNLLLVGLLLYLVLRLEHLTQFVRAKPVVSV